MLAALLLLLFVLWPTKIKATEIIKVAEIKPQVLLINQVRGDECCQPGKIEFFKQQLTWLEENELPAVFTLRYDALTDPAYQEILAQANDELFTWGLFLEITPQLAEAAEVEHQGRAENWYEAQHAYTLGYSQEDREKLVDTLMTAYSQVFDSYPIVTTSWIIDTPTLNYLHDQYGVEVHQITREQWGTDSYTLYGGPPHYPYVASQNWALLPQRNITEGVLIARQTLTDPVWNYGDPESRFTSQPNDFTQDGKDFTYFEKLLEQALFKQEVGQRGFALLGLENSMAKKHQDLYRRQLELVGQWWAEGKLELPKVEEFKQAWLGSKIRLYSGQDLVEETGAEAYWLRTPFYRLRLVRDGRRLLVTDLRLYDAHLKDYYATHQAQSRAYWITPFLIDGSRFYTRPKTWLKEEQASDGQTPDSDLLTKPQAWRWPDLATEDSQLKFEFQGQNLHLNYQTETGNSAFIFTPIKFVVPALVDKPPRLKWSLKQKAVYELKKNCYSSRCWYQPQVKPELFAQAQQVQRQAFLPEQQVGQISAQNSRLYADNPYAIAGRNPVRLVFMPRDENGVAVQLAEPPQIKLSSSQVKLETEPAVVIATNPQFYDLTSQTATKAAVIFQVGDQLELRTELYFAPNCKQAWLDCLRQPQKLWWYVRSWLGDKRRLISEQWNF